MNERKAHIWTADKLDFLERYIPAFSTATTGAHNRFYVDGFAGPGKNLIEGENLRDGSPLIALNSNSNFDKYYLVERKLENFRTLREQVTEHPLIDRVELHQADFNQIVRRIVAKIPDRAPTLFLLDPEGLELEFATVKSISTRSKADVFILISGSGVIRNVNRPESEDVLNRFFGSERWKEVRDRHACGEYPTGTRAFEAFTDLYLEQLRELGFNIVDQFLIAKNKNNVALHALVFAVKSDKPKAALNIAGSILRNLPTRTQGSLFDELFF